MATAAIERRQRALGACFPLLASAAWGVMYVVSKYSLGFVPPLALAAIRMALGGGVLVVLSLWRGERLPAPQDRRPLLGLGALVAFGLGTQHIGTDLATASQGALITTLTPAFTVLLAWAIGGEALTRQRLAGTALALAGVLLIISPQLRGLGLGSWPSVAGSLLLLAASGAWGLYTVLGKPLIRRLGALYTTTYSTMASLLFFVPLALLELRARPMAALTPQLVLALAYLGLGATALAWYLWNKGVEYVDASLVAVFFFAQPVVGTLLGWLVLGEVPGWHFAAGGLIVSAGIMAVSLPSLNVPSDGKGQGAGGAGDTPPGRGPAAAVRG